MGSIQVCFISISNNFFIIEQNRSFSSRTNHKQFEIDWKQLIDDDTKHIFSSIVDIPFHSGWLYFLSFIYIDYYSDSYDFKCFLIILRVLSVLIVLISGSAIRYQTLLNRERDHLIDLIAKNPNDFERYIVYSGTKQPLASVCLQNHPVPEYRVFVIHLYQLNSKYTDYFYDIANYTCQRLIARLEVDGNERERNIHLVWPIATCKKSWTYAVRANKFYLRTTYKDFSFMPLVNSEIEQFEYIYDYKSRTNKIRKDQ